MMLFVGNYQIYIVLIKHESNNNEKGMFMILKYLFKYIEINNNHNFEFIQKQYTNFDIYKKYKCKNCNYVIWASYYKGYSKSIYSRNKIKLREFLFCNNFGNVRICGHELDLLNKSVFITSCNLYNMQKACL